MLRGIFARRAGIAERDRAATERVRAIAVSLLAPSEGTEVSASEIVCLDPACPGTETVLLVMAPGARTRAAKVAAAAADVAEQDVRAALLEAGFEVRT